MDGRRPICPFTFLMHLQSRALNRTSLQLNRSLNRSILMPRSVTPHTPSFNDGLSKKLRSRVRLARNFLHQSWMQSGRLLLQSSLSDPNLLRCSISSILSRIYFTVYVTNSDFIFIEKISGKHSRYHYVVGSEPKGAAYILDDRNMPFAALLSSTQELTRVAQGDFAVAEMTKFYPPDLSC